MGLQLNILQGEEESENMGFKLSTTKLYHANRNIKFTHP